MYEYEAHNAKKRTWLVTHRNYKKKNKNQAMCQFTASCTKRIPFCDVMLCFMLTEISCLNSTTHVLGNHTFTTRPENVRIHNKISLTKVLCQ